MRLNPALTLLVVLLAATAGTVLAVMLALVWPDRYVTRPGWPTFYVGISALVREAPVVGAAGRPVYSGTLATRAHVAQSEVALPVASGQGDRTRLAWQAYLRERGFVPMPGPGAPASGPSERGEAYLAPQGGGVVLLTVGSLPDGGGTQARLMHLR